MNQANMIMGTGMQYGIENQGMDPQFNPGMGQGKIKAGPSAAG